MRINLLTDQQQKPKRRGGSRSGRKVVQLPLTSLAGLIKEAGRVYRAVRAGKLPHEEGRSLVLILAQMRAMLEAQHLERIETKLDTLSAAAESRGMITINGDARTDQQARLPH
jgi:hypothetical protein